MDREGIRSYTTLKQVLFIWILLHLFNIALGVFLFFVFFYVAAEGPLPDFHGSTSKLIQGSSLNQQQRDYNKRKAGGISALE